MSDFKREDYIYLQFFEDDESQIHKKGDIVRYRKDWLIDELEGRIFKDCFSTEALRWKDNKSADENDVSFDKIYKSITLKEDYRGSIYLWKDDYIYLDEWFLSHISESDAALVRSLKSVPAPGASDPRLIILQEGCPEVRAVIHMHFAKGERLDFTNPSVAVLFYNPDYLKIFARTRVIEGEEKEELFQTDFSNAIKTSSLSSDISTCEIHYFKVHSTINVKTKEEMTALIGANHFDTEYIFDDNGYIRYICIQTSYLDNSKRKLELKMLAVADRLPAAEAMAVHEKASIALKAKREAATERQLAEFRKEKAEEARQLKENYQKQKNNPQMFPGVNGEFVHVNLLREIKEQKHTLSQIKSFYRSLSKLNQDLLQHLCFYGGTIPYILTNAQTSRDFGDVDIFCPTEYMEQLREELARQKSFTMLFDSKPLAEASRLTTKIYKETTDIAVRKTSNEELATDTSSFVEDFFSFLSNAEYRTSPSEEKSFIDEKGIVHFHATAWKEDRLPYYYKIQDFGFKAQLFGVNISVFPIYDYESDIMAKSFNIREKGKFLLGVRVMNDTELAEFMQQVKVYGSVFNILPLEYTIASKRSAIKGKYVYRSDKDKADIEYILAHRQELGISDEKLAEILSHYPDYSVSIAYDVSVDPIEVMDGEDYKALVLSNNERRIS